MKRPIDENKYRPFKDLDRLLKRKKVSLKPAPAPALPVHEKTALSARQEEQLFKEAMADVKPLSFNRHWEFPSQRLVFESLASEDERQSVAELNRLIEEGQGFVVANTGEYMEATAPGVSAVLARQLHSGRFSVQDHIDLHGMTLQQADLALHSFLQRAISEGKRAVLVVHGRGLKSPGPPILKQNVFLWLTRGALRKHVIALASARSCDGGAGATYVLLRRHPAGGRRHKGAGRSF